MVHKTIAHKVMAHRAMVHKAMVHKAVVHKAMVHKASSCEPPKPCLARPQLLETLLSAVGPANRPADHRAPWRRSSPGAGPAISTHNSATTLG